MATNKTPKGTLIIIGGHENKDNDPEILNEIAARTDDGRKRLVIITVASEEPEELADTYRTVFKKLGVQRIDMLDIRSRNEARDEEKMRLLDRTPVVFFTGGDQLRITSQLGDTPIFSCLHKIYQEGGTIVGTSAGAAAMPETMMVGGPGDESERISALEMAPGLGLLPGVVIDSHFAERGRIGRLLGAVTQNPRNLGLGIDENTAIVVERGQHFRVLGSGAIYVTDGSKITYSSLSEDQPEGILSINDVILHVLGHDDRFDLTTRRPIANMKAEKEAAA